MFLAISCAVTAEDIGTSSLRRSTGPAAPEILRRGGFGVWLGQDAVAKSIGLAVEHTLLVAIRRYRAVVARLR